VNGGWQSATGRSQIDFVFSTKPDYYNRIWLNSSRPVAGCQLPVYKKTSILFLVIFILELTSQ
jgi:hypothetical protein